jgi:acyl-CoA dehydrogenase
MWDFSTDPEFQQKLDWIKVFITEEVAPLDLVFTGPAAPYDVTDKAARAAIKPLQAEVRRQGLWACHLGPELGGLGYGQIKLALMNELIGRAQWGPVVFGCAAPDTGNAEILAHYGTEAQKEKYLKPLLDGDIVSCFSMTEPHGGSDPLGFTTTAVQDGDDWLINGEKWYSSHSRYASFLIVMAVTGDEKTPPHERMSMFMVPTDTPGIHTIRNVGLMEESLDEDVGAHGYLRYENVRVPAANLLGGVGQGFAIAQTRLGGGRIHHAMRTVAECQRALDMMGEQALSRKTRGKPLASNQFVQGYIADSAIQLQQFRLLVLHTAWLIDQGNHNDARTGIAMVKTLTPQVLHDIVYRAIHLHGSWGVSNELPLGGMWIGVPMMGIVDGPTEVHKVTVAKQVLKRYKPRDGLLPTYHLLPKREAARAKYAAYLDKTKYS